MRRRVAKIKAKGVKPKVPMRHRKVEHTHNGLPVERVATYVNGSRRLRWRVKENGTHVPAHEVQTTGGEAY